MNSIEQNINEQNKNPEQEISKIEGNKEKYNSVNIERTADFCQETFNIPENKKEVCNSLNNNFIVGLKESGINFQTLFEEKTGNKLEIA